MVDPGGTEPKQEDVVALTRLIGATSSAAIGKEAPPSPLGPMPIDGPGVPAKWRWNTKKWEAWCLLHDGKTTKEVAAIVERYPDAVTKWRRTWYERYGVRISSHRIQATVNDPRYVRLDQGPGVGRVKELAEDLDQVSIQAQGLVAKWLHLRAADDEKLLLMTPADVKATMEIAAAAARLSIEVTAAQHGPAPTAAKKGAVSPTAALNKPTVRKGPKGQASDEASSALEGLSAQLKAFKQSKGS